MCVCVISLHIQQLFDLLSTCLKRLSRLSVFIFHFVLCVFSSLDVSSDFSLFEALRETIYSEVATLISQNESRPHFLIELFHELQLLNTDYLRQRALYSLQVLCTLLLTHRPTKRLDVFHDFCIHCGENLQNGLNWKKMCCPDLRMLKD